MRAVCVEVTEYTGVGGMLEPGCRVDLVAVVRDDKTKEPVARTVLQNIKVSAIGRSTVSVEPPPGQPLPPPTNSVTILCTPAQVQTLELASMAGRPWLVLRGGRDTQEVQVDSTRMSDVLGKPSDDGSENANTQQVAQAPIQPTTGPSNEVAAVTPAQPVNPRWTVRVIQGETESSSTFTLPAAPRTVEADTDVSTPVIPGSK
jgi:Flp pilus assembly protein CpaB